MNKKESGKFSTRKETMYQLTNIRKQKWDWGMNTYFNCNGSDWWLSSTKMSDGTTLYNVYKNDEMIFEDDYRGYHQLVKAIRNGEM